MLTGTLAFTIAGCEKTSNSPLNNNAITANEAVAAKFNDSDIPDSLQVPEGNKFTLQAYAEGVQIYQVQRSTTDNNAFLWVNVAPSATLYSKADFTEPLGIHYKGPTWEFTKGQYKDEKVVAARLKGSVQDPTAIPWLLLQAVDPLSSDDNQITYIQRIYTEGGMAPATPASEENLGQLDSIPYTALYVFYEARHTNQ